MYRSLVSCLTLLLFVSGNTLFAQTSSVSNPNNGRENNPYSKYGIGELWNGNNTQLKGMGNITSAYADPFQMNTDNPASYASLLLTTFEGGAIASSRTVKNTTEKYSTGTASLSHLSIGIPISRRKGLLMQNVGGIALGLRPYSRAFYSLVDTISSPMGRTIRSYAGDGGLSHAFIGGAYKYKHFSVGANFGYIFGTYRNFTTVVPRDTLAINNAYTAEFARYTRMGGVHWKVGALYERAVIDSEYHLRIGATYTMGQNIRQTMSFYQVSIYNFGDSLVNDTSLAQDETRGKLKLPTSFSAGVMLARSNKWSLGVDYTSTTWSEFKSSPDTNMNFGIANSTYKMSLGGEYTPNPDELKNYFARVTYRMGVYYGTDYVLLKNTTLPCYGITFGGSFPFKRSVRSTSRVHTSFDIGRMGTTANGLIQQTYVRFGVGLTFNDKWFIQRKYD